MDSGQQAPQVTVYAEDVGLEWSPEVGFENLHGVLLEGTPNSKLQKPFPLPNSFQIYGNKDLIAVCLVTRNILHSPE